MQMIWHQHQNSLKHHTSCAALPPWNPHRFPSSSPLQALSPSRSSRRKQEAEPQTFAQFQNTMKKIANHQNLVPNNHWENQTCIRPTCGSPWLESQQEPQRNRRTCASTIWRRWQRKASMRRKSGSRSHPWSVAEDLRSKTRVQVRSERFTTARDLEGHQSWVLGINSKLVSKF